MFYIKSSVRLPRNFGGFSVPKNWILLPDFLCMVLIKSYLLFTINVEIFCLNTNNFRNITEVYQTSGRKVEFNKSEILSDKIS